MALYGLIEWDSSMEPSLIVGETWDAIDREAARLLILSADQIADDPEFLEEHSLPDLDDPTAVDKWLGELKAATTIPWYTRLEPQSVTILKPVGGLSKSMRATLSALALFNGDPGSVVTLAEIEAQGGSRAALGKARRKEWVSPYSGKDRYGYYLTDKGAQALRAEG